ncbi:hypothetical protein KIPB_011331, partial [Kipferlia bialata]
ARRERNSTALVNACVTCNIGMNGEMADAKVLVGCVAESETKNRSVALASIEAALNGMSVEALDAAAITGIAKKARAEVGEYMDLESADSRAHSTFRVSIMYSIMLQALVSFSPVVDIDMSSADLPVLTKTTRSSQKPKYQVVGHSMLQSTGKSKVVGDAKFPIDHSAEGMAHGGLVLSARPHAKIVSIDTSAALAMEGVIGWVDSDDIPGANAHSGIKMDTTVFAKDKEVVNRGQPIGMVVAETRFLARQAAKMVQVEYEDLPCLPNIAAAMKAGKYFDGCGVGDRQLHMGDVDETKAQKRAHTVIKGTQYMLGQDHMYLETHNSLVVPKQDGCYQIYVSTQNPSKVQYDVALNLAIPNANIEVSVQHIGGGFGGKQDRPCCFATAAASAAAKYK